MVIQGKNESHFRVFTLDNQWGDDGSGEERVESGVVGPTEEDGTMEKRARGVPLRS